MPSPNDRSRLVHRLTAATGLSAVWVYRLLEAKSEPKGALARRAWRDVMSTEPTSEPSTEPTAAGAP